MGYHNPSFARSASLISARPRYRCLSPSEKSTLDPSDVEFFAARAQEFQQQGKPVVMLDENVSVDLADLLTSRGIGVLPVIGSCMEGKDDHVIYTLAHMIGTPLVTHDKDFQDKGKFDLKKPPCIIILPSIQSASNATKLVRILRAFVLHAVDMLGRRTQRDIALLHYAFNNTLSVYTNPLKPHPLDNRRYLPMDTMNIHI